MSLLAEEQPAAGSQLSLRRPADKGRLAGCCCWCCPVVANYHLSYLRYAHLSERCKQKQAKTKTYKGYGMPSRIRHFARSINRIQSNSQLGQLDKFPFPDSRIAARLHALILRDTPSRCRCQRNHLAPSPAAVPPCLLSEAWPC